MLYSLGKVGWTVLNPSHFKDKCGAAIALLDGSPAMLARMYRNAYLRAIAQQGAGGHPQGRRR